MNIKHILATTVILISTNAYAAGLYEPVDFSKHEVIFSSASRPISITDPTIRTNSSGSMFPGGRGTNQLVIYTPAFGDRTNTNEFGTEAVVQDNVVTMMSGANSFIPKDGIVISGHGSAKSWINKNITIGTKVYIDRDTNTLTVYTTSESYMYEADEKITETKAMMDFYRGKTANYGWKNTSNHIEQAQDYLKKAQKDTDDEEHVQKYTQLAIMEANEAMASVLPYMAKEVKGIWLRPTEQNESQIISALNNMQETGITDVFLETFYHGKTIFPSKTMENYGFNKQNEQFAAFDPLKIWITEAHKRNMKIHIWFQSFYVGNTPPAGRNILAVKPQWGNKTKSDYGSFGPTRSSSEHNGYFMDPANPQVQEFLTLLVTEIICNYCPDGINLDYIRYPQSVSKSETGSWGYTEYARNDFKDMYGTDPVNLTGQDTLWREWENYRREHITNFVRKIGTLGRQKGVYVSTVIFPDLESALSTKQQDWRTWSKRNYVNGFTPLFLTYDPKMISAMMSNINTVKSPSTDVLAGIFVTFMGGTSEDLIRQIHETRKLNANGVILFDYAHTTPQYAKTLAQSAFKPYKEQTDKTDKKKKKKGFWIFKK